MQPLLRQSVTHQDAPKTDVPPMLVSWQLPSVGVYTDTSAHKRGGSPLSRYIGGNGRSSCESPVMVETESNSSVFLGDTGGGLY